MKITLRRYGMALLASAAFYASSSDISWTTVARAEDVPPVVDALIKNFQTSYTGEVKYEKIENSGNIITVNKLTTKIVTADTDKAALISVEKVTFSNVASATEGLIPVGSVVFDGNKMALPFGLAAEAVLSIPSITYTDWYIPVDPVTTDIKLNFRNLFTVAKAIDTSPFSFKFASGETAESAGYSATSTADPATAAGHYDGVLKDTVLGPQIIKTLDPTGQLMALGYSDITLNGDSHIEISVNGDKFNFLGHGRAISKNMGSFIFDVSVNDIPMEAMYKLKTAKALDANPNYDVLQPYLKDVVFNSAQIRFEDASITKKILPLIAKSRGLDEPMLISTAVALTQVGLSNLRNPEFTKQTSEAVNSFLTAPKSLTISMKPASPLKGSDIQALDPNNPSEIITRLGVQVKAND